MVDEAIAKEMTLNPDENTYLSFAEKQFTPISDWFGLKLRSFSVQMFIPL